MFCCLVSRINMSLQKNLKGLNSSMFIIIVSPPPARPITHTLPQQPGRPSAVAAPKPQAKPTGKMAFSCHRDL